jgi:hypothetical protein
LRWSPPEIFYHSQLLADSGEDCLFFARSFCSGHLLIRWARSIDAYNLRKSAGALPWRLFLA